MFIHLFFWGLPNSTAFLLSSYLFSQRCSSWEHHYLLIVHPIMWGPRLLSSDCKLILLVGMRVVLTFKPQGAPDMSAYRELPRCMRHESIETDIQRLNLKIVSRIFSVSGAKWARGAEGWPALRVTDVSYVWHGLAKSSFRKLLCYWSSDSSDNSTSRHRKWSLSNSCVSHFKVRQGKCIRSIICNSVWYFWKNLGWLFKSGAEIKAACQHRPTIYNQSCK